MPRPVEKTTAQSCGNAGPVESMESQKQASHSFHEPLGNFAKGGRDSHIPTAAATRADGKVENQKQVFHFPTAPIPSLSNQEIQQRAGYRPPPERRSAPPHPATSTNSVTFSREATRRGVLIVAEQPLDSAPVLPAASSSGRAPAAVISRSLGGRKNWKPSLDVSGDVVGACRAPGPYSMSLGGG